MATGVNFLKLFDADLGVNRRGVEFLMPQQLLDEPDVRPVFQHVRRAGVPEQMARRHAPRHLLDPRGQPPGQARARLSNEAATAHDRAAAKTADRKLDGTRRA